MSGIAPLPQHNKYTINDPPYKNIIENAASIAGLFLTTECAVSDKPEKKKEENKEPNSNYAGSVE